MRIESEKTEYKTSKREDLYLSTLLDSDYTVKDIEKIVDVVVREQDTTVYYIIDVLYAFGYEFITKSDIDVIFEWLKKHKIL